MALAAVTELIYLGINLTADALHLSCQLQMHTTRAVFADLLTGGFSFADIKALEAPARASLRAALYSSTKTMVVV